MVENIWLGGISIIGNFYYSGNLKKFAVQIRVNAINGLLIGWGWVLSNESADWRRYISAPPNWNGNAAEMMSPARS